MNRVDFLIVVLLYLLVVSIPAKAKGVHIDDPLFTSMILANAESSKVLNLLINEMIELENDLNKTKLPKGKVTANKILSVLPDTKEPSRLIDEFFKYQTDRYREDQTLLEKVKLKRRAMKQIVERVNFNNTILKQHMIKRGACNERAI